MSLGHPNSGGLGTRIRASEQSILGRSEEHTSELQSRLHLVCRLLLEKKNEVEHGYADFRARREATVWQRLNRILLVLLIIAIWLVIVSLFVPPYKKLMQSRTEIDNLQQRVNEQHTLLARQTREVSLLKTDASYLETIARDRLDLMKEGETIFRIELARVKAKPVAPARK